MRLVIVALLSLLVAGCAAEQEAAPFTPAAGPAELVEVYHFHGTVQCASCIAVGDLAEKTVSSRFSEELDSGRLVFAHVNGQQPEHQDLVHRFGATGSSLWIGTTIDGQFHREQNINVWYKIRDEQDYITYLSGVIGKRLAGDLS